MPRCFVILVKETDVDAVSPEKLVAFRKLVDCLRMTGNDVRIPRKTLADLSDWARMYADDSHGRDSIGGLTTDAGNLLELLISDVRPLDGNGHAFNLAFDADRTSLQLLLSSMREADPVFISYDPEHQVVAPKVVVAHDHDKATVTDGILLSGYESALRLLGRGRTYHYSPKHGENGVGGWDKASKLLCSGEHAQALLDIALQRKDDIRDAWQWDPDHNRLIHFYYEGDNPQHQWHAFHIFDKDLPTVPNEIKKFFGVRAR